MSDNQNKTEMAEAAGEEASETSAMAGQVGVGGEPGEVAARLAALQEQAGKARENWERYLRTAADFENYKKRAARERQEAGRNAQEGLLGKVIPVLDNFEMALAAVDNAAGASVDSVRTGVTMIYNQLRGVLAEAGLEAVEAVGHPFDPNWHEAVAQAESAEVPEGQVLQQLRRGYRFQDRLLRPATVVVAKAPGGAASVPTGTRT
jgi:molecular chaperone GrpE